MLCLLLWLSLRNIISCVLNDHGAALEPTCGHLAVHHRVKLLVLSLFFLVCWLRKLLVLIKNVAWQLTTSFNLFFDPSFISRFDLLLKLLCKLSLFQLFGCVSIDLVASSKLHTFIALLFLINLKLLNSLYNSIRKSTDICKKLNRLFEKMAQLEN